MAAPISQLKNYSQEVATHFGTWTDTKVFKSTYRIYDKMIYNFQILYDAFIN